MEYIQYQLVVESKLREILIAFLGEMPFDTLEETENGLNAYLPAALYEEAIDQKIQELTHQFRFKWQKKHIPAQNWNALWESNFQPIQIGHFCGIRASFHPPFSKVKHEIIINPKMAFGTGHHETTFMMIQMMQPLNFKNAKVLDFGCGTGILSILASFMEAIMIDAVDIEEASYENTIENVQVNNAHNIHAYQGTLDAIIDSRYDFILANINRNVILKSLSTLYDKLDMRGCLLISGILKTDENVVTQQAKSIGFTLDEVIRKGEWVCLKFYR